MKKTKSVWQFLKRQIYKSKLTAAISLAVLIALGSTVLAVYIYEASGTSQLDLSRPGLTTVREKVGPEVKTQPFSSDGPINVQVLQNFLELYNHEQQAISNAGDFGIDNLSDDHLQISVDAPPTNPE